MRRIDTTHETDSHRTLALVLAGGSGSRLQGLTRRRAKPAVPFGGHHRIVDFSLSNCVNSGVQHIALLTQYQSASVAEHVERSWQRSRDALGGHITIEVWPAQRRSGDGTYAGTADAVHKNRDRIEALDPDDVLIVASDHVYAMDYAKLRASHARNGADVTVSCIEVPASQSRSFGIVEVDDDLRIKTFVEKPDWPATTPGRPGTALASMGIYLFDADYLLECLEADARDSQSRHDFGYSVMPRLLAAGNVYAYPFRDGDGAPGYWRDVGTVDSYWAAHQELLTPDARLGLRPGWPMFADPCRQAPARLASTAAVCSSFLGSGCVVSGTVTNSVLSADCRIGAGSCVRGSVLLPGASVGRNCRLDRVIVDSDCCVPDGAIIDAAAVDPRDGFYVSPEGIVLVTAESLEVGVAGRRIA